MSDSSKSPARTIGSTEELLAYSLAMETEAVDRFNDLADQMETHHNYEVADMFRKMQPWHAIKLAMHGEMRAAAFYRHVAETAVDDSVLKMALELVEEEEKHVALLKKWQERYPKPAEGWDEDLDPPAMLE